MDIVMRKTQNECALDCLKAEDACGSYSYSEELGRCFVSRTKIKLGSDWDYYEREAAESPSPKQKILHMIEKQKDERTLVKNALGNAAKDLQEYEISNRQAPA